MVKRLLNITLFISLVIISTACQGINAKTSTGDGIIKPGESGIPEINILVTPNTRNWMKNDSFVNYEKQFEKQYGVKVNYQVYGSLIDNKAGREELMIKLLTKDGPELILDDTQSSNVLIKQGAVVEVNNKIQNINKIYDSLVSSESYYIPIGINSESIMLRQDALDELKLPMPEVNWTREDYNNIYNKWLEQSSRIFTRFEFSEIVYKYFRSIKLFDYENKKANINTQELRNAFNNIRSDIFSGKYILSKNYTYENYYNMLFEYTSEEYKENNELLHTETYEEQSLRSRIKEGITNALITREINLRRTGRLVVLPNCFSEEVPLWSLGFMVNRNGANLELAYEYVNGLLSDEMQLQIYKDERLEIYPVSKEIEDKINDIEKVEGYREEAIQLRQFILEKVKKDECWLTELEQIKERENYWMLVEDLTPFIFAEKPYKDAELSVELQKLEDKYNIYLSE
jgi:spermidine/putrescine-binding protein